MPHDPAARGFDAVDDAPDPAEMAGRTPAACRKLASRARLIAAIQTVLLP